MNQATWDFRADKTAPLRWKRATNVFVLQDLFSGEVTLQERCRVIGVMGLTYRMFWTAKRGNVSVARHRFTVTTTARETATAYLESEKARDFVKEWFDIPIVKAAVAISRERGDILPGNASIPVVQWIADGFPGLSIFDAPQDGAK